MCGACHKLEPLCSKGSPPRGAGPQGPEGLDYSLSKNESALPLTRGVLSSKLGAEVGLVSPGFKESRKNVSLHRLWFKYLL
jgi:hypothetical protein